MTLALASASIEALGRWLTEESARIAAAQAEWLSVLADFDRRGGWGEWGVKSPAHWLELRTGATPPAARESVRVARALDALPRTREAFARGEVHESAVRAIARCATPETEDVLLHFTKYGTGGHVLKLSQLYRRVLAVEDPDFARHVVNRYVRFRYDDDGSLRISARFPADEGALVRQAIQRVVDQLVEEARAAEISVEVEVEVETDQPQPSTTVGPPPIEDPELRRLLGFDEPEPEPIQDDIDDDEDDLEPKKVGCGVPIYDDSTRSEQLAADAFLALMTSTVSSEHSRSDRYLSNLHIDIATLRGEPGRCELDGIPIPAHIGRMLACDSSLVAIVEDESGRPLEVSRRKRSVTKKLEIAVKSRDDTCRMTGCHARRHLHIHHIEDYVVSHQTRLGNLIRLCGLHHRAYHAGEFEIRTVGPGEVEFVDRRGDLIEHIVLEAPDGDLESVQRHMSIDAETCRPRWAGDHPDYSVAIDHLLARCGLVNLKVSPALG